MPLPGSRAAPLPVDSPGGASGRCHSRALQGTGTAPDTTAAHSAAPSPGAPARQAGVEMLVQRIMLALTVYKERGKNCNPSGS